jgi:predicted ATPase
MYGKNMQKITIRSFGPIKDVELPISDIIVLNGAQASGKSTISKSIYFFIAGSDPGN